MTLIVNPFVGELIKADPEVRHHVHEAAEEMAEVARQNAPVDTGELRDSIHVEDEGEGSRVVVGTDHWIFPEFGTVDMAPEPYMRPAVDQVGLHR